MTNQTATTSTTPVRAPEALVPPEYTTHRPGPLDFSEVIRRMGGKPLNWSKHDTGEPFSVTFTGDLPLAKRILQAGTFDVLVLADGNYALRLTSYELDSATC